jgi:hypothetical protein
MDSSFRDQGSSTQQNPKRFLASLPFLDNIIKWMASLIRLTEEEQEEAGIYLDRPGGE